MKKNRKYVFLCLLIICAICIGSSHPPRHPPRDAEDLILSIQRAFSREENAKAAKHDVTRGEFNSLSRRIAAIEAQLREKPYKRIAAPARRRRRIVPAQARNLKRGPQAINP